MQRINQWLGRQRWQGPGVVLAILLVIVLYGSSLHTTYRKDDLVNVTWASQQSWRAIWTEGQLTSLYRPLIASLRKLLVTPQTGFNLIPLKLVHFGLYVLSGVMTGQFAYIWWRREARIAKQAAAVIAVLMFITLPFAYESVPWVSTIAHPLVTTLALGAMLAYDRVRRGGGMRWLLAVVVLTLLAPLAHELGFLTGGFLVLMEIRGRWTQEYQGIPYWLGGLGGAVIALYMVRQSLPNVLAMRDFSLNGDLISKHVAYLLQSASYPTMMLSGTLTHRYGVDALLSIGLVGLPTLFVLFVLLDRAASRVVWMTAVLWMVMAASLMGIFMPYLLVAPHYLVFMAPGAAVLWAGALASLAARRGVLRQMLLCGLLLLCVIPGLAPVMLNMDHLLMLDEVLHDIAEAGKNAPTEASSGEKPILFVNVPFALFPSPEPYAIGDFGTHVYMLPDFYPDQSIYMMSGREVATQSATFFNLLPDMPYDVGLLSTVGAAVLGWEDIARTIHASSDVYLTHYAPDRIRLRYVGRVAHSPSDTSTAPAAIFREAGVEVRLLAADVRSVDERLALRLTWAIRTPPDTPDLDVFIHLYDGAGKLIAQDDGPFLGGLYPLWMTSAGEYIEDYRHYPAPVDTISDDYTIGIGLWNVSTGERITPLDETGSPLASDGMFRLVPGSYSINIGLEAR